MWIGDSAYKDPRKIPLFFQRLHEMGVNTAMVYGDRDPQTLLDNRFPYYVENMLNRGLCLKFNSKVTDWDRFVTSWADEGRPESALVRDFCLDDSQWQKWAGGELERIARKNQAFRPLAYNLRDELSITVSANPFDYDFNPVALAAFRDWLKTQYPDLLSLNQEWETGFRSWEEVKPFTTDQIKNRMASGHQNPSGKPDWQRLQALRFSPVEAKLNPTRWNFSPWADFRTYMDLSLARALESFRQTAHKIDSHTPVGIEGTQMPHAFGGYDLWRLAQVLDWVEPYDIGCAREILGSFMQGKPILTTVFENETDRARRRLWHLLLEGDRGCIVWWSEDCIDWQSADYQLSAKAKALEPVLKELTSPLAQLFLRATPEHDPLFIHYSQPSIQVDWLLESTIDGSTWLRRYSSFEADHNEQAKVRTAWLKVFQDLGYSPQFISSQQIEDGMLKLHTNAALILSSSWALSDKEVSEIRAFLNAAPTKGVHKLFANGTPGIFDHHGKLRQNSSIEGIEFTEEASSRCIILSNARSALNLDVSCAQYLTDRMRSSNSADWQKWVTTQVSQMPAGVRLAPASCTRTHRFQIEGGRLLAFERNINYQMNQELKQAGGNEPLEKPVELEVALPKKFHVYELRTQKYLGWSDRIHFVLNSWEPSLFAIMQSPAISDHLIEELLEKHLP